MSPRRLFATPATLTQLKSLLLAELAKIPPVQVPPATTLKLQTLLNEATAAGATQYPETSPSALTGSATLRYPEALASGLIAHEKESGALAPQVCTPILLDNATPAMAITRSDIFAPVLSLIAAETMLHVPALYAQCPYALTVSIFTGQPEEARSLAHTLKAGTVLINDLIAPTADPRLPFGGRGDSGFGLTRGAEGLLEMTALKTIIVRKNASTRHLEPTTNADAPLFAALIATVHGGGLRSRLQAISRLINTARSRR